MIQKQLQPVENRSKAYRRKSRLITRYLNEPLSKRVQKCTFYIRVFEQADSRGRPPRTFSTIQRKKFRWQI